MRSSGILLVAALSLIASGTGFADPPKPGNTFDYTGRIQAVKVEIRPRVTGILETLLVKEGARVKKGDVLAGIDPRQYKADVEVARAKYAVAEAGSKLTSASLARTKTAVTRGALSKDDLAQSEAEQERAEALLKAARAELDLAELNLSWTKLISPMDGVVGRFAVAAGNLVTADGPAILSVVATDPLYVVFEVDERTMLKLRRDGVAEPGKLAASVGLADEEGYPHPATLDFIDPQFDSKTGTVLLRGVIANPKGLMSPNMFVKVRLTPK